MSTTWIAETRVVFVHPDGRRAPGRIAFGLPVAHDDHAACPYDLLGLEEMRADGPRMIHGEDNLQALLLAVQFVGMALHHFTSRGGRVAYAEPDEDGDTDMPLADIFGPLLRDRA